MSDSFEDINFETRKATHFLSIDYLNLKEILHMLQQASDQSGMDIDTIVIPVVLSVSIEKPKPKETEVEEKEDWQDQEEDDDDEE